MGRVEAAVGLGVGRLELAQDAVAEPDRVGQVLEPDRVLGEPGHREGARNGAERQHELLVARPRTAGVRRLDGSGLLLLVDARHAAEDSSACGHICRSGTTMCRGSSVPDAASGSIGV